MHLFTLLEENLIELSWLFLAQRKMKKKVRNINKVKLNVPFDPPMVIPQTINTT